MKEGIHLKKNESPESIETFLKSKGVEHPPKIKLNIFFMKHETEEDAGFVLKRLQDNDVLSIELIGQNEEQIKFLNQVSQNGEPDLDGKKWAESINFDKFYATLINGLKGLQKPIISFDLHAEKDKDIIYDIAGSARGLTPDKFSSYEENKQDILISLKKFIDAQTIREEVIGLNIKWEVLQLLRDNPGLKNKKEIKILFAIGSAHTRLTGIAKEQGLDITRDFYSWPHDMDLLSSMIKLGLYKGSERVDEQNPSDFLLFLLFRTLGIKSRDIKKQHLESFSEQERKELFDLYKSSSSRGDFSKLFKANSKARDVFKDVD